MNAPRVPTTVTQHSTVDALAIRRRLGREQWRAPQPFGPDGFTFDTQVNLAPARIIVSAGPAPEGLEDWLHASISRPANMPDYEDLTELHRAVWGDTGWAYQCFAPASTHVNIHAFALHLWGRPDGRPALPNFGAMGSI